MKFNRLIKTIAGAALAISSSINLAHAGNIAVFGSNSNLNVVSFLNSNGHTATNFGAAPTAADLIGYDAVIALRADGNNDIADFVTSGGLLITEWRAAEWALDVANLLDADGGGNVHFGGNTPITHTAQALAMGLGDNLPNPYSDGPRTEFQWTLNNIGASVDVLATRPGDIEVILGGQVGNGYAFINSLDWADGFSSGPSTSGTWLLNALDAKLVAQVPAPTTLAIFGLGLLALRLRKA